MRKILIEQEGVLGESVQVLIDVLQAEGYKNASQQINVTGQTGEEGEVLLVRGKVLQVNAAGKEGEDALAELLGWDISEILINGATSEPAANLDATCCSVDQLLLKIAETVPALKTADALPLKKEEETMLTLEEKLENALRGMVDHLGGVDASMLVDEEGFVLASYGTNLGTGGDVEMIGGITTSLITMTSKVANVLNTGDVDRIMLHGDNRHVFISPVNRGVILVTIAKKDASLGLIFAELRNTIVQISNVMNG